jgi:hypothetical protein
MNVVHEPNFKEYGSTSINTSMYLLNAREKTSSRDPIALLQYFPVPNIISELGRQSTPQLKTGSRNIGLMETN